MEQMRLALEEWLAKGGAVVTQSNVAQVVRERIGADVERRREKIRLATAAIAERGEGLEGLQMTPSGHSSRTPSGVKPAGQTSDSGSASSAVRLAPGVGRVSYTSMGQAPPGGAAFPPVIELAPRVPSSLQYVVAASLGVLAAASLGAGGFWVWKSLQPAPASQSVVVVTPVETEPAILPPTPPSTGTVVPPPRSLRSRSKCSRIRRSSSWRARHSRLPCARSLVRHPVPRRK